MWLLSMKKIYYYILGFVFAVVFVVFLLLSLKQSAISNYLLVSFYTNQISIFDPNSNKVVGNIDLGNSYVTRKILRYNDFAYVIATHQIILINSNGSVKKIVNTNETIADAMIKDGKLYAVGLTQAPGIPCNSPEIAQAFKTYIITFDPSSLSELSKVEFDQKRTDGFTILNDNFFLSSFFESKIYQIYEGKIVKEIQLQEKSYPSQVLSFGNEIIVIGRAQIFSVPFDLSTQNTLLNESICDYYSKAFIYNNKLYATCFTGNKTIVYDLIQNKLIKQINTTLPFYVWGFKDKIFVTSAVAKKLYTIDPNTNEVIAVADFEQPARVIG